MKLYTSDQVNDLHLYQYAFINLSVEDHVMHLTLDRANKKNALHPQMVNEIAYALHHAHYNHDIWMITISAKGNVFCAGADLKAMAGIIEEHDSTVPDPGQEVLIGELFNKVYKPTIAKITGDVYAGGFFFLAGCNIVVAQDDVKFGLPEVKRGLYPFQVMAALMKVMPARKVIDWCIRAYNLPVQEALQYGLVSEISTPEEIDGAVQRIIDEIKQNSPTAIRMGLESYDQLQPAAEAHQYLYDMLQKTVSSKDGQEGLSAFREKRKPEWTGQ